MKVFLLDNYDSFTYNLVHYIESIINDNIEVKRPHEIEIETLEKYDVIVLSPGPGLPSEKPVMNEIIKKFYTSKIILGICLGHQAIAEFFGADLNNLSNVFHGVKHTIYLTHNRSIFYNDINHKFDVARYHSWEVIKNKKFDDIVNITSVDKNGSIMSIEHKYYPIYGLQYHPESIFTPNGLKVLNNFFTQLKVYK
jgi:anthranilate synthase component II